MSEDSELSDDFDDDNNNKKSKKSAEDDESDDPEPLKIRLSSEGTRKDFKHIREAEAPRRYRAHKSDPSKPFPKNKWDDLYIFFGEENIRKTRERRNFVLRLTPIVIVLKM